MKKAILHILLFFLITATDAQVAVPGEPLPAWQKGYLDIHHINTGRGNAAFFILPDGTTMLVDAGELSPLDQRSFTARNASIRPDSSRKPYEWIAAYIRKLHPETASRGIDYALITHFHDDHFGAWYPSAPASINGNYLLTGITGLAELLPVKKLIDRGYPDYHYPYDIKKLAAKYGAGEIEFGHTMENYFSFLAAQQSRGYQVQGFQAGSRTQLKLVHDAASFPSFYVQQLKANDKLWTGKDSSVRSIFPTPDPNNPRSWPDENSLSLAFLLHYGAFTYYTGGDNPGMLFPGDNPLRDVETAMAAVTGEVDVAVMDHHGNRDAINEAQVKTLQPRVWIGQTWSADHPGHEVLVRMTSTYLSSKPRDLFATNMLEANRVVIGPLIDRAYKSQQGHIVVRVSPLGDVYYVIVLDDSSPNIPVKSVFGPYQSKQKIN